MLKALSRPTFIGRKSGRTENAPSKASADGPVLPSLGYATRGGEKHNASEDRVFTSTLASVLGATSSDLSFADMLTSTPELLVPEEVLVAGVFDGHGGAKCVQYVAENLCDRIGKALTRDGLKFEQLKTAIFDGFKACDEDFLKEAQADDDNSGCCALMAFISQTRVMIGWSGDCRAVYYDGNKAHQVTIDHRPSDAGEKKRILELGGRIVNNRISGILAPSRCFGNLDLRNNTPEGVVVSEPSIVHLDDLNESVLKHRTSFLILATDGVWDVMPNETACMIVARSLRASGHNPEAASLRLVEEASRMTSDDVSVCIVTWSAVPWDIYSGISRESYASDEGEKH